MSPKRERQFGNPHHPLITTMEHHNQTTASQLFRSENGSVSFISLVIVLGMAVLIGFVGNMASETIERQKLQNAADATAYSQAVWMARGMNTICTLNHIMGELTSVIVIIEALGGPEAEGNDFSSNRPTDDKGNISDEWLFNNLLQAGRLTAPDITNPSDFPRVRRFVNYLVTDHPMHKCGAAVYDAEVNLKMHGTICLTGKTIANVLISLRWIPYVGPVLYVAGKVLHVVMNVYMTLIETEMRIVRGIEKAVAMIAKIKEPIRKMISGLSFLSSLIPLQFRAVLVGNANYFQEYYSLYSLSFWANGLPVIEEPWQEKRGDNLYDAHEWEEDGFGSFLGGIEKQIKNATRLINKLPKWMKKTKKRSKNKINGKAGGLNGSDTLGWACNPSIGTLNGVDAEYEQRTQLARATYPYVDMYRTPFRTAFSPLLLSKLKTFFTAWTYRYTLNESFSLHKNGIRMFVMTETDYERYPKGAEPWTNDAEAADEYFSVLVAAESEFRPSVFSPSYFKKARKDGSVAISQAMIYNLNGRNKDAPFGRPIEFKKEVFQPNTGWDTLQWKPSSGIAIEDGGVIQAREWKSMDPLGGGTALIKGINDFISGGSNIVNGAEASSNNNSNQDPNNPQNNWYNSDTGGMMEMVNSVQSNTLFGIFGNIGSSKNRANVRLNWQAKLRPVTRAAVKNLLAPTKLSEANGNVEMNCTNIENGFGIDFLTH